MDIKKRQIKEKIVKFFTYNILKILGYFVKKKKNIWIFGAWHGELFMGNPKYFYLYVKDNCPNVTPVWLTKSKSVYKETKGINGIVYLRNTFQALYYGLIGKVYIFNTGIDDVIHYSLHNAKIINLWHGMPTKKLNSDKREIRNYSFLRRLERKVVSIMTSSKIEGSRMDLLIATSESTKKNLFKSLKCHNTKITGQPRDDIFYHKINRETILKKMGLEEYGNYIIISYLPTFRDKVTPYHSLFGGCDRKMINDFFKKNPNVLILEKSHYHEKSSASRISFQYPNYRNLSNIKLDTQELLYITDILITDYSSLFIDFLHLDRPIIFYAFDYNEYYKTRGFFYKYEEVACGKIVCNLIDLFKAVLEYIKNPELDKEKRISAKKLFHNFSDGQNSKRVYEEVLKLI